MIKFCNQFKTNFNTSFRLNTLFFNVVRFKEFRVAHLIAVIVKTNNPKFVVKHKRNL